MLLTPYGNYRFRRLAMGLKNSAQSFEKLMNFVLDGLDNVFSYLDDILVFTKDDIQHKKVIRALFHRLEEARLTINLKNVSSQDRN